MTIHSVSGDLFTNSVRATAFAHGCNIRGTMGAGIAAGFKRRYPVMFASYLERCRKGTYTLGDSFHWSDPVLPDVFNLATQVNPGGPASFSAIESALRVMRQQADEKYISRIAIPRIGAGHGRLQWTAVRAEIDLIFALWPGDLYIYEEYIPNQ